MQIGGVTTVENSVKVPQKVKHELLYDPGIPVLVIYMNKPKTLIGKNTRTPMFIAALFIIAKT